MAFKTGIVVGFAAGYYFGSKAGRERYHQLQDLIDQVKDTPIAQQVLRQARSVASDTKERALVTIEQHKVGAIGTPPDLDQTDSYGLFGDAAAR